MAAAGRDIAGSQVGLHGCAGACVNGLVNGLVNDSWQRGVGRARACARGGHCDDDVSQNWECGGFRCTPLHLAAENGHETVMKALIEMNPVDETETTDKNGYELLWRRESGGEEGEGETHTHGLQDIIHQ